MISSTPSTSPVSWFLFLSIYLSPPHYPVLLKLNLWRYGFSSTWFIPSLSSSFKWFCRFNIYFNFIIIVNSFVTRKLKQRRRQKLVQHQENHRNLWLLKFCPNWSSLWIQYFTLCLFYFILLIFHNYLISYSYLNVFNTSIKFH